jgi:uncharacterized repeat protein (TIGR01451 family)
MKRFVSFLKRLPKRFSMIALMAVALFAIPLQSAAAADVLMEGSMGVANQTRNETEYKESTNAKYDEVVKFQVFYHNRELANSGRIAENFKIKIDMPTTAGRTQNVRVTMKGDNTNTITDNATVMLDRSDAMLEFIPGTVYWKHNVGSRENIDMKTEKIADSIILNGTKIENVKPCHEFEATVTFMARVKVPSVGVQKVVRKKGAAGGVTNLAVLPGDRLEYILTGKNLGNARLDNLVLRDALPKGITFVPGTVKLYNGSNPQGVVINNNYLFSGGVNTGHVGPGAQVFITFEATVDPIEKLACGLNTMKNVAIVDTEQTGEYNNSATVTTEKKCDNVQIYACKTLTASLNGKEVTLNLDYTVTGGATFKNVAYNFGDGSAVLVTDKTKDVKHAYTKEGEFKINAILTFRVAGEDKKAECATIVKIGGTTPPVTPPTLPNTGAGDVIGIFTATTAAGAVAHRLFGRRLFQ